MTQFSRRRFIGWTAAGAALGAGSAGSVTAAEGRPLRPMTKDARPIAREEHAARVAKLQSLMQAQKVAATLVEAGSSLEYFTGIRWGRSERTTAAVIPAQGGVVVVTPFFEVPSVEESLRIAADVRSWHEDEDPFALIADAWRAARPKGPLAVEWTTRYFIVDHVRRVRGGPQRIVSGEEVVNACRTIKSPAELALMQTANDVTLAALKHVYPRVERGMGGPDIAAMLAAAHAELGASHQFALVLLNEASAYPHGSAKPQQVQDGSVILIDTGCKLHGYASDISRTWVHGRPTRRQREVWNTVKRGQQIALEAAKLGRPVGDLDHAVRRYYEGRGWAKDYGLPGTSHRTGHGIGMDGHEPPNLMRADRTPLAAGMCFSVEPGIYIPGEFGVRLEDIWHMTKSGPKLFTPLAKSLDDPI